MNVGPQFGTSGARLRAIAFSMIRCLSAAFSFVRLMSRSFTSGSASFPNSSIEDYSISCGMRPACERKITWSMPESSNSLRRAPICAGVPTQSAVRPSGSEKFSGWFL